MAPSSSPQCGDTGIDDGDQCHQHGNSSSPPPISQSNNNNKSNNNKSTNNNNNKSNDKPPTTERAITLSLLRKRSEHNSNLISTLEELALHQEELTTIGPYLGRTCGKTLKILLLQNNVISKMEYNELKYLKRLEYLNLALNNISKIEGLSSMEWLRKLDLTLNFVNVDDLEESVDQLEGCRSLEELFLLGNPCMGLDTIDAGDASDASVTGALGSGDAHENTTTTTSSQKQIGWKGCRAYIIARLPHLQFLDGKEIKPSERIVATQQLSTLTLELHSLAEKRKREREKRQQRCNNAQQQHDDYDTNDDDHDYEAVDESYISDDATTTTHHDPETRTKLSNELHDQKTAKEQRQTGQQAPSPKGEREWEEEHGDTVRRAREREERGIKQCNQGKYQFWFEEESPNNNKNNNNNNVTIDNRKKYRANLVMRVAVPKHLSTSLIDVDIHPTYVSIVIKSKVLRVSLPAEVRSDISSARRSAASGYLELVMPKVDPNSVVVGLDHVRDDDGRRAMEVKGRAETITDQGQRRRERLGQSLLKEGGAVSSLKIVRDQTSDDNTLVLSCSDDDDDDDGPPPLR